MKINKDDYLICRQKNEGRKDFIYLIKANRVIDKEVHGVVEKFPHIPTLRKTVEVPLSDVILNLGDSPYPGKVLGCDTHSLYRGIKTHDDFGSLHFFYKPKKDVFENLNRAFSKAYKHLRQNGLDFIVDSTCLWEIVPPNGEKYAGMYKCSRNPERVPHILQIRPEVLPASEYVYVILHELAHHLHAQYAASNKLNARWIALYSTSIASGTVKKDKANELLEGLLGQSEDIPSTYKSNLNEEDTQSYKLLLSHIKKMHGLSVKELDLLFEAQYFDDITAVWPVKGISVKELKPIVTEYATKNYMELVAESISLSLLGKKFPKDVQKLVARTLDYAKGQK